VNVKNNSVVIGLSKYFHRHTKAFYQRKSFDWALLKQSPLRKCKGTNLLTAFLLSKVSTPVSWQTRFNKRLDWKIGLFWRN
jgi:hypothetical protein